MQQKEKNNKKQVCVDRLDQEILNKVFNERNNQYLKWGDQHHTDRQWEKIFNEEYAEALCKIECGYNSKETIEELVQSAAVICAWIRDVVLKQGDNK